MSKKRGIMLAAVLVAVLGGLLWLLFNAYNSEPAYKGKRLSAWLEDYAAAPHAGRESQQRQEARNAIRHIGTNAIPTLLRMLRARDSALTLKLVALAQKQHFVKIHYVPAPVRNNRAEMAFGALRGEAKDAVPALMRIYEENISPESRFWTVLALSAISPDAKVAVPLLLKVATDTNTHEPAALLGRFLTISTLGQIHAEPELVVPALAKVLSGPDEMFRKPAARALREYGPDAKAAVPALFELLKDKDRETRREAAAAIKTIDPEAAAQRKGEIDAAIAPVKPQ